MKQQQLGKKQNWFLRTARRIAAPLIVAGLMTLGGGKADAIQTRLPSQELFEIKVTTRKKMGAAALLPMKLFKVEKYKISSSKLSLINKLAGRIKDPGAAKVFRSTATPHLKKGGKVIAVKKRIMKPFKPMTEPDKANYK